MKEHTIWNEKFRSTSLDTFVAKDDLRVKLQKYIETNDIPHLLFSGQTGSGKTTLAKLLVSNIKCNSLSINASDENGIDNIRDKVKSFASAASITGELKIVILDEADFLTPNAQAALRNIIETFSRNTRFILTCNYIERLIEPLQSRCTSFQLESPSKKYVSIHIATILKNEGIEYDKNDIVKLVNQYYPDIRRIINSAQADSLSGTLVLSDTLSSNYIEEIFNLLKNKKNDAWKGIRQIIVDNDLRDFQNLYSFLYEKYFDNPEVVVIIADYQYKQSFVADKEICFMACVAKILEVKNILLG
jgi:replication factor C small subunit